MQSIRWTSLPAALMVLALPICVSLTRAESHGAVGNGTGSRYLDVVRRAGDALLKNGRDTYGEVQSGIILSNLDPGNGRPREGRDADGYRPQWGMGYGVNTSAMFATRCCTYAETTILTMLALHEHFAGLNPEVPVSDITR